MYAATPRSTKQVLVDGQRKRSHLKTANKKHGIANLPERIENTGARGRAQQHQKEAYCCMTGIWHENMKVCVLMMRGIFLSWPCRNIQKKTEPRNMSLFLPQFLVFDGLCD